MEQLVITISYDTMGEVNNELEMEAEERDGHMAGALFALLCDTVLEEVEREPDADGVSPRMVRFRLHALDWERIKAYAGDALEGEQWDESPAPESEEVWR